MKEDLPNVLVLCTGNSCRSQLAEGYLRKFLGDKARVFSAGVEKHGVNPMAVWVMLEDGVDISKQTSNLVDEYIGIHFSTVITVCDHANERCPVFPNRADRIHCNFADPSKLIGTEEEIKSEFRRVRNEIREFCKKFANSFNPTHL
ncbi:MAG: arsenate reductase ArsC [Bacteroidia bacterium]|nr:arsenate reductase ArsC [Bacteroidia bacterium]